MFPIFAQNFPQGDSSVHVPGWRLYKPQRNWWEKHLWGQVQGRKLSAEAHCKFVTQSMVSIVGLWLLDSPRSIIDNSTAIFYIHAGSRYSFHGQRWTSHKWQPVFHLHRYEPEAYSKKAPITSVLS